MTLYAHWQENSSSVGGEAQPEVGDNNSKNTVTDNNSTVIGKNLQTGDNIITTIIILGIAIIGIIITTN